MTRTNLQLAKTGVRNPPVYFCRQCIAVRVFEESGICTTCVNVEANNAKAADGDGHDLRAWPVSGTGRVLLYLSRALDKLKL